MNSEDSQNSQFVVEINQHALALPAFWTDLHRWGIDNRRVFPWRTSTNPFHVLMAEMMLRRTRADQVVRVYNSFIERYADPRSLADAEPAEVAEVLYSLGLAWRVPAFRQLARILVERYDGEVPASYEALISLPGVGDYVASAVCCFVFEQPVIIADTNTVRVAGRIFDIPTHAESRRRRPVRELLEAILDQKAPATHNYALLDLAALVCTPESPACHLCPVARHCRTGQVRLASRTAEA